MSTGLIPLKKTKGKMSQGKKVAVTPKNKSSILADDNIIHKQHGALKLGKSMSLNKAEKEKAARRVHATYERLITESDEPFGEPANRPTGRRRPSGIAFKDNSSVSKKKLHDQSQKLKGIQTLTAEEQLAANTMQPLKVSKSISKSRSRTRSSSEGAGGTPEVPDNSTGILTTSSEGTGIKPGVPDKVKGDSEAKVYFAIDWGSKNESEYSEEETVNEEEIECMSTDEEEEKQDDQDDDDDDRSIDIKEIDDDERTEDEFVHGDEYVHDDVDEGMKDAEDDETWKDNEEITNAAKTEATKDDYKQARKLPPTSSILSVSSGFGNQFLNLSSDISLIGATKESANTKINSLLDIQIQQEVPQIQSPSLLKVPILVIPEQTTPTPSLALLTKTLDSTVPPPPLIFLIHYVQRVSELEKEVKEIKRVDHYSVILATIRSEVSSVVNEYLRSSLGDSLQKVYQKHTKELKQELKQQESQKSASEIIKIKQEHTSKQNWLNNSSTPFDKTA
ncbi:hypothetical protein Tco_0294376 [Tanacetum coccineum]